MMVVMLGASTGGPAAVKEFIDALPHRALPICFILANHITQEFLPSLEDMLDDHPYFNAEILTRTSAIKSGKLFIAPVDKKIKLMKTGEILLLDEQWTKPYAPNISDLFLESLKLDGVEKLAIVFSGMDNDGTSSADIMTENGVEIWCQTIETCAAPSMPTSIMKTGKVVYKDSPKGLAHQLTDLVDAIFPIDQYA